MGNGLGIVGIIGAGTMGNGIAQICAAAGLQVVMVDISDAAVSRGVATIGGSLDRLVKKDKMSAADRDAVLGRINGTTDKAKLSSCDLVIEAATENYELKLKILKQVDAIVPPEVIIASNTGPNMIVKSGGSRLSREAAEPVLERGMAKTMRALRKAGADLTLIQDMAMSKNFLPSVCVSENRNNPGACTFKMNRPRSLAYDLKAARRVGGVEIIDPLPKICPMRPSRASRNPS